MDVFNRMIAQAQAYWAGLSTGRRVGVVLSFLGVLLALGAVAYLSPGAAYTPLTAGPLAPEDVAAMRTRLTADAIPFRLTGGGTGIEVPEDRRAEAVVSLASAGIPASGGKGFEVFDETSLMTTPFAQSVNYQRALQAELARSIMQMEAVQSARVMIAKPEPSPFVRDQKNPTASVILKLKPRASLSAATAGSIVSLVAHSIEGLRPENVTVVDTGGRLLSDPHAADRENMPTPQLEYMQRLEAYLSTKAEEMLGKTLGPGRAVVRVNAEVNFQKIQERVKSYSPERVAIAERSTNSTSTGVRSGGIAGATSNVTRAGGTTATTSGSGGTSKEEVLQTDYLVPETIRDIVAGTGGVTRLSVAAIVDLTPQAEGQPVISQADAEEIIRQAVGFRPGRDTVTIARAPLTGPNVAEPDDTLVQLQKIQVYVSLARNLSVAVAAVLAFVVVGLLLLRRRAPAAQVAAGTEPGATPTGEPGAGEEATQPTGPTPPPTAEERRNAELIRFQTMARNEPAAVVQVLSVMLGEKSI